MRVVPVPEVEERVAAEDAGAVASKGVVEAEGEEGVWVAGEEAEPEVIVADGES